SVGSGPVRAAWPERTITIIAHFAPGGSNDLLARLIASELGPVLKQAVIVENRPGANGNIGLSAAARATPDGYTLVVASGVVEINPSIRKSGYEMKDFAPVAYLGASPNVILTRPASGIATIQDLIAKAKAEPGKITYSSPGDGRHDGYRLRQHRWAHRIYPIGQAQGAGADRREALARSAGCADDAGGRH